MTRLFVDTSAAVALAFEEPGHERVRELMSNVPDLFAAPLLEAEFRSALAREGVEDGASFLSAFRWVLPDRALTPELDRVFARGYTRGADEWHLATALFLVQRPEEGAPRSNVVVIRSTYSPARSGTRFSGTGAYPHRIAPASIVAVSNQQSAGSNVGGG